MISGTNNRQSVHVLLADKQDISRMGIMYLLEKTDCPAFRYTEDKHELIFRLTTTPDSVVIIDYTLFDFNGPEEMLILAQRFPASHWLLFCEELSTGFIRRVLAESMQFSVLLKDALLSEIQEALRFVTSRRRFICRHVAELLLSPKPVYEESVKLTKTETEILKDIAWGFTTREIAERRISSFHTVNTHRKNIFRKIGVNNVREAIRFALCAGLIDSAEYYI